MAVTGDLGGQQVRLDNAAQEDTLRRIEDLLGRGLFNADGSIASLGNSADRTAGKLDNAGRSADDLADSTEGASQSMQASMKQFDTFQKSLARSTVRVSGSLGNLARSPVEVHKALLGVASDLMDSGRVLGSIMGATLGAAITDMVDGGISAGITASLTGGVMGALAPALTGALAGVVGGAFLQILEDTATGFNKIQQAGGLLGGSMLNARIASHSAGLTMEQFSNVMQKSSQEMAMFGGQTIRGAAAFADFSKSVTTGETGTNMLRMGVSFEEMGVRTAEFMAHLVESGVNLQTQGFSASAAAKSVEQLTKQQKALAAINGTTLDQEREKQRAARKDAQLNASMIGLTQDQRQGMQQLVSQFPQFSQFIKETVAFGGPVSKASLMQVSQMGATTDALGNTIEQIMAGGGQGAIDAFKQLQETSPLLQRDLENQAELVKLGLVTQNEFINVANQNFQDQFELFNKSQQRVVDSITEDFDKMAEGADNLTTTMINLQQKQQESLNNIADIATKLTSQSDGIGATMLGIAEMVRTGTAALNTTLGGPSTLRGANPNLALPNSPGRTPASTVDAAALTQAEQVVQDAVEARQAQQTTGTTTTNTPSTANTQASTTTNDLLSKLLSATENNGRAITNLGTYLS